MEIPESVKSKRFMDFVKECDDNETCIEFFLHKHKNSRKYRVMFVYGDGYWVCYNPTNNILNDEFILSVYNLETDEYQIKW